MKKITNFIIEKRLVMLFLVLIFTIISTLIIPKVQVNYDMSKYLPKKTNVSKGIFLMEEEFGNIGSAEVMVKDIEKEEATKIYSLISNIEGVKSVDFEVDSLNYFKNNKAIFIIMLDTDDYSNKSIETIKKIETQLENYNINIGGGAVSANALTKVIETEMSKYGIVALILKFIVLILISKSWIEPFIFLTVSGISILINYGSNIIFENVSFVTFSIAAILQLALSMDYSIMLLNKYHYESSKTNKIEAMKKALLKSINTISASSLTTVFGLLAMIFMSFTIGKDIGLVLAKGILINVLIVLITLPALILLFDNLLEKTKKKSINIGVKLFSKTAYKGKIIIPIIMLILLIGSYIIQTNLKLNFAYQYTDDQITEIENEFGKSNQVVLLYDNNNKEENVLEIINFLKKYKMNNKKVLNNVVDYYITIGKKLTSMELANLTKMNNQVIDNLFLMYNQINQTNVNSLTIKEFISFLTNNAIDNPLMKELINEENKAMFLNINKEINKNESLLKGTNYNRMIIKLDLDIESDETYSFFKDFKKIINEKLKDSYIVGNTALSYSIKESFSNELLLITILTIISMIVIISITFKSLIVPLILTLLIQSAIFISMCFPVILNKPLYFLAYIIAQCIQMGATIDYAILLSYNYIENREKHLKKESLTNALKASVLTIFTSATILITATLTIAFISSQELISLICTVIARGTLISTIIVLFVLPSFLYLFDNLIEKTTKNKNFK